MITLCKCWYNLKIMVQEPVDLTPWDSQHSCLCSFTLLSFLHYTLTTFLDAIKEYEKLVIEIFFFTHTYINSGSMTSTILFIRDGVPQKIKICCVIYLLLTILKTH